MVKCPPIASCRRTTCCKLRSWMPWCRVMEDGCVEGLGRAGVTIFINSLFGMFFFFDCWILSTLGTKEPFSICRFLTISCCSFGVLFSTFDGLTSATIYSALGRYLIGVLRIEICKLNGLSFTEKLSLEPLTSHIILFKCSLPLCIKKSETLNLLLP